MQLRQVELPGAGPESIALTVAEAGVGGRPLLLVHGFTGAKEDFTEWLDPLAELGWHAVAPDQRGHGASHQPDDEAAYSFDTYAADLLALLDALGWDRAVVLGHSMGGMVVQTAAVAAPHRFEALILMDTSHRAIRADGALVDVGVAIARTEGMAALLAAQEALAAQDQPLGTDAGRRVEAERPGYKEFGDRKLLASSPAMYATMLKAITDVDSGLDRLDDLRDLPMPALVIVGDQDSPFLKPSRRMAEAIPGAELAVIPGAGHSPQFESPEPWWKALRGFLDRLEP
jgi:pimeloyl-ACP methyl ester carboxylesterase